MNWIFKIGSYLGTFNLGAYTYMQFHGLPVSGEKWIAMILITVAFGIISNLKEK